MSASNPPNINGPAGLIYILLYFPITGLIISCMIYFSKSFKSILSSCWVDITTVSTLLLHKVTWALPSGFKYLDSIELEFKRITL